jgi:hypothetical protein
VDAVVLVEAEDTHQRTARLTRRNPAGKSAESVLVYMVAELSRQAQQRYLLLVSERARW